MTNADLAKAIGYPLVVVARNKLGVVHQVLAACEAAVAKGLNVNEIVLNDVSREADDAGNSNERLLAPFLAKILPGVSIRREAFGNETGSGDQA
jgi:dethiobiotin synthetase